MVQNYRHLTKLNLEADCPTIIEAGSIPAKVPVLALIIAKKSTIEMAVS